MVKKKSNAIKISSIIMFLYIISSTIQSFTAQYEGSGAISQIKYIVFLLTCMACLLYMNKIRQYKIFKYEFKSVLWIIMVFVVISIFRSITTHSFTTRTIQEILFMAIPILFSYCILNSLNKRQINKCMMITLIVSMLGYLVEMNMNVSEFISALGSMSFSESYSKLESSTFAGVSIAIAMYYIYFSKNKLGFWLSIIFVILTFKRLAIVFMVFLIITKGMMNCDKQVSKGKLTIIKAGIILISLGYFIMMIPENVIVINEMFNIDLYKLTMSRTYRFSLIYNKSDFINTGFGSTYTYMMNNYDVALEMDIIKLIIEVTPIGVMIFVNNMTNIVKKNWYCMVLMLFQFFNLITSHNLASVFSWIVFYITVGCIMYKNDIRK